MCRFYFLNFSFISRSLIFVDESFELLLVLIIVT